MVALSGGLFGAANDLLGGIGNFMGAQATAKGYKYSATGSRIAAASYGEAAGIAGQNAALATASANIQKTQSARQVFQAIGGQSADVAGAGFGAGGSAGDLLRSSVQQGALQRQLLGIQGEITSNSYEQEQKSFLAQQDAANVQAQASDSAAKSAKQGGFLGALGTAVKVGAGLFSLFSDEEAKTDITLIGPSHIPGVNRYLFRYKGDKTIYEGVIAQEVVKARPDAVDFDEASGLYRVDYDVLGLPFREVA